MVSISAEDSINALFVYLSISLSISLSIFLSIIVVDHPIIIIMLPCPTYLIGKEDLWSHVLVASGFELHGDLSLVPQKLIP